MLCFLECLSYFVIDDLILLFVALVELLGLVDALFYCLWIFLVVCVYLIGHEWVLWYWSFVDMSEYFGTGPLWT
jgi:hypothetical protein